MQYNEDSFKEDILYPKEEKVVAQMELDYQAAFGTVQGRRVLNHLMAELGFFREPRNEEEIVLHNFAKRILRYMGIWKPGMGPMIIKQLLNLKGVTNG